MSTELENVTWQSMDDVLVARNENGHLEAPISFAEPTVENMGGFDRVLFFVKGKITGGTGGGDFRRTEVSLTEENNYSETHPIEAIEGEYKEIGVDTEMVKFTLGENGITISKYQYLTTPGTYNTVFAFVGDDWAEIFVVQIVITVPLRVQHGSVQATHGQTLTINMTSPNYSPQYLYVYGSRSWVLEGVESGKINVSPTSGNGYDDQWSADVITISKPSALTVEEKITTTFRILAQTQWVDVTVNFLPPSRLAFVAPRSGEVGAPAGTDPVYIYF